MPKTCEECGREIYGRSDKKYCSDACRNARNNRNISDNELLIRQINQRLKHNRRILKRLNPKGKVRIPKDRLFQAGFVFNFFTSTYTTRDHRDYRFCYEQGYLDLEDGYVLLVQRTLEELADQGIG